MVRPSIAGLMGAYGCALISLDNQEANKESEILKLDELENSQLIKNLWSVVFAKITVK